MQENPIISYLKRLKALRSLKLLEKGYKYYCFEDLLLKEGKIMQSRKAKYPYKVNSTCKHCFYNCQEAIKKDKSLIYVEGYAIARDVPLILEHAWLLHEGYVLDPTWKNRGLMYFGISMNGSWVEEFINKRNCDDDISVIFGNDKEKFSLLKEGMPVDAKVDTRLCTTI